MNNELVSKIAGNSFNRWLSFIFFIVRRKKRFEIFVKRETSCGRKIVLARSCSTRSFVGALFFIGVHSIERDFDSSLCDCFPGPHLNHSTSTRTRDRFHQLDRPPKPNHRAASPSKQETNLFLKQISRQRRDAPDLVQVASGRSSLVSGSRIGPSSAS